MEDLAVILLIVLGGVIVSELLNKAFATKPEPCTQHTWGEKDGRFFCNACKKFASDL